MYVANRIGNKIKKIRELKGYTRDYIAAQLEMSISSYSRLERDEISITLRKLQIVSTALGVNYLNILSFDENQLLNYIDNSKSIDLQKPIYNIPCSYPPNTIENLKRRIEELERIIKEKNL